MPGLLRLPPLAADLSAPLLPSVILCPTVDTVFSPLAFLSCCIAADTCPLPSTNRVNLRTLHHSREAPSGLLASINSRVFAGKGGPMSESVFHGLRQSPGLCSQLGNESKAHARWRGLSPLVAPLRCRAEPLSCPCCRE